MTDLDLHNKSFLKILIDGTAFEAHQMLSNGEIDISGRAHPDPSRIVIFMP